MQSPDLFRRKLAHRLTQYTIRRRQDCADDPTGEDLKIIGLCERLAIEAEQLDPVTLREVENLLADEAGARRFHRTFEGLSSELGITVWPKDAAQLVRWMVKQANRPDPVPLDSPRS